MSLADDAAKRFEAYDWNVIDLGESGEDLDAIENALLDGKSNTTSPTIIILRTHIGHPSPTLTDSPSAHGYAFKDKEIIEAKELMGLPPEESFFVPAEVLDMYRAAGERYQHEAEGYTWRAEDHVGTWNLSSIQDRYEKLSLIHI